MDENADGRLGVAAIVNQGRAIDSEIDDGADG
jgi:hypothetical protein